MSVTETIRKLGWVLDEGGSHTYRAVCPGITGSFPTPWRNTPEEALNDLLMIKASQNREAVGPQKGRWA